MSNTTSKFSFFQPENWFFFREGDFWGWSRYRVGPFSKKTDFAGTIFFCLDKNSNGPANYPQSKLKEKTLRDKLVAKNPLKSPAISGGGSFDG